MAKVALELKIDGTLPFVWWVIPIGKEFETHASMIPPPTEWTVCAYKNYCIRIVKKYKLPIKISWKKGNGTALIYQIDDEPEEIILPPDLHTIPLKK